MRAHGMFLIIILYKYHGLRIRILQYVLAKFNTYSFHDYFDFYIDFFFNTKINGEFY